MELYLFVIKLFLTKKEIYDKYYGVIDLEFVRSNYPEIFKLLLACKELRSRGVKEEYAMGELEACLLTLYPNSELQTYGPLLQRIKDSAPDEGAILGYLNALYQRVAASKLAFLALDVAEGKAEPAALQNATAEFSQGSGLDVEVPEEMFVSDDIEQLLASAYSGGGLNWRLNSLNRSLGPLRKGDFGFIFARPETGKTTLLASEVTFMAPQADGIALWINNEEKGEKVGIRCYQAALGATLEQILGHQKRAREKYYEITRRQLRIVDKPGIDRRAIESLCRSLDPALIVVDQLDKVEGFDGDREDLRMGSIYQWARELAKEYAPLIGVCQADGSGEGVKYLTMGNVANAKTAKQAEADFIFGIGASFTDDPRIRGINVSKNKLLGGETSDPKMRHAHWDVLIQPEIGRYIDMGGL